MKNGAFELSPDGRVRLRGVSRTFEAQRAIVVLVHGVAEHSGRYGHVIDSLNSSGFGCIGYDQRGHGRSDGVRVYVDSFGDYLDDLDGVVSAAAAAWPKVPLVLLGHSMGALVVLHYALAHQEKVGTIIVIAPPFDIGIRWWERLAVSGMARSLPKLQIPSSIDPAALSNLDEIGRDYMDDTLNHRKMTPRWLSEFLDASARVESALERLTLPVLMLHGEEDAIAKAKGTKAAFARVGSADKQLKVYPRLRHELLNEVPEARSEVLRDICRWIDEHA